MTHYDDIEEFKGGGRISPKRTATDYPQGTLLEGRDGKVWINQPDKNGRLSWQPTEDYFPISSIFKFPYQSKFQFDFYIYADDKIVFILNYEYDTLNSWLQLQSPSREDDVRDKAKYGSLEELLDFFNENFDPKEFDRLNKDPNLNGELIQSEVRILFSRLKFLMKNYGLRNPYPKFEVGQTVQIKGRLEKYVITKVMSKDDDGIQLYEGRYTETGDLFTLIENTLELATDKTKFKRGDKVKLPKTKSGQELVSGMSNVYDDAKNNGQDYLVVTEVWDNTIMLDTDLSKYGDYFSQELDKLELYVPEPKFKIGDLVIRIGGKQVMTVTNQIYDDKEKMFDYDLKFVKEGTDISLFENQLELYKNVPQTPFQQIDFLSPSTEENDVLIKTMSYYSDGLTFVNSSLANLKFKLKDRIGSLEVLFDKVNNIIKISEPSKNINVWSTAIQQKISDESITEITNLYFATLEKFIEIAEAETPSKECEADPNKIISGQVKKFYDLNKTRIDKLDSKFSCKIVQALVSLSEYESCGSPSSVTLPKVKSDLLSRISNLKI